MKKFLILFWFWTLMNQNGEVLQYHNRFLTFEDCELERQMYILIIKEFEMESVRIARDCEYMEES